MWLVACHTCTASALPTWTSSPAMSFSPGEASLSPFCWTGLRSATCLLPCGPMDFKLAPWAAPVRWRLALTEGPVNRAVT